MESEVPEWLAAVKRKWNGCSKDTDRFQSSVVTANKNQTLDSMFKVNRDVLLQNPWKIIKCRESSFPGIFDVWLLCQDKFHQVKIKVPKIFYVNSKVLKEKLSKNCQKVTKTLPRLKISHNLYEYSIDENSYNKKYSFVIILSRKTLALSASSIIEGVYETNTPSLFRLIFTLGQQCSIKANHINKIIPTAPLALNDLEPFKDNFPFPLNDYIHLLYLRHPLLQIITTTHHSANDTQIFICNTTEHSYDTNLKKMIYEELKR
ncbi:DNA polymerase epsilon catalytic subunit A [Thelohanellus kitauei]|uniref:DNA polymerase epsilon catalytic subunit n=1 Tax=Thelohanellus kitauei TaxID=669202 RepID=A0A0C2JE98_THEKT|nr:DNA polymerase epsilon catalytic subunit A [Thelohanellus kitauei]